MSKNLQQIMFTMCLNWAGEREDFSVLNDKITQEPHVMFPLEDMSIIAFVFMSNSIWGDLNLYCHPPLLSSFWKADETLQKNSSHFPKGVMFCL